MEGLSESHSAAAGASQAQLMSTPGVPGSVTEDGSSQEPHATSERRPRDRGRHLHALKVTNRRLKRTTLKLLGYLLGAFLVLRLIPGLGEALAALQRVQPAWVLAALALEGLSETGFVLSWRAIVDPDSLLGRGGRSKAMDRHVAWTQLGGGTLIPGGSLGGLGVGAVLLHRFGMPNKLIAERQFNLSFLNTGVDALALVVFGLLMATGMFGERQGLALTLLPALLAGAGIAAALLVARRSSSGERRRDAKHPKLDAALATVAEAVEDTERLLLRRGSPAALLGAVAYLGFDVLVLWGAFVAIGSQPLPSFPVVLMAYIIGALGGSLPLPAGLGTIGGMVGMLILYGVGHSAAVAAVVVYEAVGMLVPLIGGGIAYVLVRRELRATHGEQTAAPIGANTAAGS